MVVQFQQPPYPLHPSVKDRLHPDYVTFYNKYLINQTPVYCQPVSASREAGNLLPGPTEPIPVGKKLDILIARKETCGPKVAVRCFTPPGSPPRSGWPLVLYSHGGGWVLGDIDSESTICTNMCARGRAVVITTDYRLANLCTPSSALSMHAPGKPYPLASLAIF